MILRRVIEHFRKQEWTAIAIDFLIVVLGVFVGLQVNNWNAARKDFERTQTLLDAFRVDLRDYEKVVETFTQRINEGIAAFDEALARGEKPAPFYLRFKGSDTPPDSMWEAALQSGLAELVSPDLAFEIGYLYSEQQGIGERYVRYSLFVENEILPRLSRHEEFYDEAGALKPAFAQSMERLREWTEDNAVLVKSARCLQARFDAPLKPGPSCRPDYGDFRIEGASP